MTLFSLLVFFQMEKHPVLQMGPQAGTLHLKLLLVGFRGSAPQEGSPYQGGWDCQMPKSGGWWWCLQTQAGRQNRATGHATSHTPLVGAMPFFKCVLFHMYTHFLVLQYDLTNIQTDPERKLQVFSDDGYVFTVFSNR